MGRSDHPEDIVDEKQNGIRAFRRMQAQHDRDAEFDLLDLAVVVRRGWLTILSCMALFLGRADCCGMYRHHPAFAAEAELLADVRAGTDTTAPQSLAMADTVLSSRVEVITSSASLHALAQEPGPTPPRCRFREVCDSGHNSEYHRVRAVRICLVEF